MLREAQIYRIDHYLGKETVQNILVFRFANGIFEPIWNRHYIDHVQITVAETVGVEGRGGYYDDAGALRDMVPEPHVPAAHPGRDGAADLVRRRRGARREGQGAATPIRPITPEEVLDATSCAASTAPGTVDGKPVPGYREEHDVPPDSRTPRPTSRCELMIDNWRWAGVPFYLRTGKRLTQRATEIAIQFKQAAAHAVPRHAGRRS